MYQIFYRRLNYYHQVSLELEYWTHRFLLSILILTKNCWQLDLIIIHPEGWTKQISLKFQCRAHFHSTVSSDSIFSWLTIRVCSGTRVLAHEIMIPGLLSTPMTYHDLNLAGLFWSNTNDLILLVNRNSRFRIYRLERSPIFYKIIIACFMLCIFKVILMLDNIITASDINETSSNLEDRFYIHEEKLLFKIQLGDRSRVILIAKAGKIRWARRLRGWNFFLFIFFPLSFLFLSTIIWQENF